MNVKYSRCKNAMNQVMRNNDFNIKSIEEKKIFIMQYIIFLFRTDRLVLRALIIEEIQNIKTEILRLSAIISKE